MSVAGASIKEICCLQLILITGSSGGKSKKLLLNCAPVLLKWDCVREDTKGRLQLYVVRYGSIDESDECAIYFPGF